jgi:hypothetical protein
VRERKIKGVNASFKVQKKFIQMAESCEGLYEVFPFIYF